jgi:dTDP-4-amino-4,6-dideoxygalactose transaminase
MKKTFVTQPFLPPMEEFIPYLEKIWDSKWLTNAGPYHEEFEAALAKYLGVQHIALFANGTIALVTALQALRISGEVITTPYSFVATAHSLVWNSLTPVYVDIDPKTCNLDPDRIVEAITPRTTAIMPVHCYGNPCDVERIQKIADIYGLKVIYDSAHAFGVTLKGESLLNYGDLSVLSFHATKVFTTFEGGAIVCPDAKMKQRIDYLKNFGYADEVTVMAPGINGKMNEVQAAIGLLQLKYADECIRRRREIDEIYRSAFAGIKGLKLFDYDPKATYNGSYFPVFVGPEFPLTRDDLYHALRAKGIIARRYFYPLISAFPMYRGLSSAAPANLAVASAIAEQVLCLPIYPNLCRTEQDSIIQVIRDL